MCMYIFNPKEHLCFQPINEICRHLLSMLRCEDIYCGFCHEVPIHINWWDRQINDG